MALRIIDNIYLSDIACAIREKNGTTDPIATTEMAAAITNLPTGSSGYEPTDAELTYNIGEDRPFYAGQNAWVLKEYGDRITFTFYSTSGGLFNSYPYETFDANVKISNPQYLYLTSLFSDATSLKVITGSLDLSNLTTPVEVRGLSNMFSGCTHLKEINNNFIDAIKTYWCTSTGGANARVNQMFSICYSLRELPTFLFQVLTTNGTSQPRINGYSNGYVNMFNYCTTLNKIENLPVIAGMVSGSSITSNMCSYLFNFCCNLSKATFQTNDDGTPMTAAWANQTIDLTKSVGYAPNGSHYYMIGYNSGYTAEDRVPTLKLNNDGTSQAPEAQYFTLGDYWTDSPYTAKFGHTEAVELINSLPDTSAAGGGNTIKFQGAQGKYTDYLKGRTSDNTFDSSINTLTDTEIAVATAKGWTVTLV